MAKIVVTQDNTTIYVGSNDVVHIDIPGGGTVTIKAAPGENVDNFKIHFRGDDHSDKVKIDLATFSQNDLHIDVHHYDPTDEIALVGAFNKGVDPGNEDEFQFSYVCANGNTFTGFVHAKDGGEKDFTDPDRPIVICFAEGTTIETALDPRPVESIRVQDHFLTRDNGSQPVRWVGRRRLDSIDLMRHPQMHPIRIKAGAFRDGTPYTDLSLSPQHRVQISDWRTEFLFAESNVLVAATHLVNGDDIVVDTDVATVTCYHPLLNDHEVLTANGVGAESLHPGDMASNAVGTEARSQIDMLFPNLADALNAREIAHPVLRGFEAQAVAAYAG